MPGLCLFIRNNEMNKKILIILILIAGTVFSQVVLAENMLEILTPPAFISAQSEQIYIVGKTDAPIVEIFLNDEKLFDLLVKDSIFHASITYGYGVNEVTIIPIYSGQSDAVAHKAKIDIMYGPEIHKKFKKIYTPYFFHETKKTDACDKCHTETYNSIDSLSTDQGCLSCHVVLKDKIKKHTKDDKRVCVNCHQQFKDKVGFTTAADETNLCFNCHTDRIGLFSQDYIHGPVAGGSCNICHEPHGSIYEHNLVTPEQILCFSCHEDLEENTRNSRVKHNPFEQGQCGVCHDPHSTSNKWVLVQNSEEVCLGCHNPDNKMTWHSHPYNVKPKRKLKVNVELNDNGNLECISCHNPHANNSDHLLRITEEFTCIGCHTDVL